MLYQKKKKKIHIHVRTTHYTMNQLTCFLNIEKTYNIVQSKKKNKHII